MKAENKEISCNDYKIYCQIKRNNPNLNNKFAKKLSKQILKSSKKYDIPSRIFTAILMQESSYRLNVKNCAKGLVEGSNKETIVCSDFGIAQIHFKTIKRYGFDKNRLTKDLEYSIDSGAKVLAWFYKTYSKKEKDWYCRYNAGTGNKKAINKICNKYLNLVKRYL